MDLNIIWFVLMGVLLAGYAVLDGFDFGVGMLHGVARTDEERRIVLNAIGPIWDGNEVWLVVFGGALLAAFPEAYATAFSGFYTAFMLLLFALIGRAISIEFRSKLTSKAWRGYWDFSFFGASLLASLLFGIAVGAAMVGVPLNERGVFIGRFQDQIGPYPLAVGAMTVAMFVMHGAIFLHLKTEGDLHERLRIWMWRGFGSFLALYMLVTIMTLTMIPRVTQTFAGRPWAWAIVLLNILAIANIPRAIFQHRAGYAFMSSRDNRCPRLPLRPGPVPKSHHVEPAPRNSLTIYNAASSQKTLGIMGLFVLIGMPFVGAYSGIVYWTFRGKVKLEGHSY